MLKYDIDWSTEPKNKPGNKWTSFHSSNSSACDDGMGGRIAKINNQCGFTR